MHTDSKKKSKNKTKHGRLQVYLFIVAIMGPVSKNCNANANGLLNVIVLGVVTQSPAPEARVQYARRHRFWRESWFLWREKHRRTQRKPLGVRLRSTNHSPRTSPGSNPGRSGGRRGWWQVHQPDSPIRNNMISWKEKCRSKHYFLHASTGLAWKKRGRGGEVRLKIF